MQKPIPRVTFLVFSLFWLSLANAGDKIYFAANHNPILGVYDGKQFTKITEVDSAKAEFVKIKGSFSGYEVTGERLTAQLKTFQMPEGDLGESLLDFQFKDKKPSKEFILASKDVLELKNGKPETLADPLLKELDQLLRSSFEKAKKEYHLGSDELKSVSISEKRIVGFFEANRVVAFFKLSIKRKDGEIDNRGQFFAIVDSKKKQVVYSTFGHPEWAPDSATLRVEPAIYFSIKGSPKIYFLGSHDAGWESSQDAIYDLATGHVVAIGY